MSYPHEIHGWDRVGVFREACPDCRAAFIAFANARPAIVQAGWFARPMLKPRARSATRLPGKQVTWGVLDETGWRWETR